MGPRSCAWKAWHHPAESNQPCPHPLQARPEDAVRTPARVAPAHAGALLERSLLAGRSSQGLGCLAAAPGPLGVVHHAYVAVLGWPNRAAAEMRNHRRVGSGAALPESTVSTPLCRTGAYTTRKAGLQALRPVLSCAHGASTQTGLPRPHLLLPSTRRARTRAPRTLHTASRLPQHVPFR